ncbi:hypothetical protein IFM89_033811, partial [Coptis chinensis]
ILSDFQIHSIPDIQIKSRGSIDLPVLRIWLVLTQHVSRLLGLKGIINLELQYRNVNGITLDPKPDWSLDDLVSELNSLELKQNGSTVALFTKTWSREFENMKGVARKPTTFVMRVSDDEDSATDDEESQGCMVGKRFSCTDLYASDSDSSEDELALEETQFQLMDPVGLLEGLLSEREMEHQQWVEEEIRHRIALLEADLMNENERSISALVQLEKLTEARRELDRKRDTQYQRKIAEDLDNYLIAIQRDHEHKSQIEERKIRNDAAFEDAKRKERALQEEKARQLKAREEAEAAVRKAEEARKEALEIEKRMAKEAAEKQATESKQTVFGEVSKEVKDRGAQSKEYKSNKVLAAVQAHNVLTGAMVKAAESALKVEEERLGKYKELVEKSQALRLSSDKGFRQYELQIGRHVRQIVGTRENVSGCCGPLANVWQPEVLPRVGLSLASAKGREKASELIKIINNPLCPQTISLAIFAKKFVSLSRKLASAALSSLAAKQHPCLDLHFIILGLPFLDQRAHLTVLVEYGLESDVVSQCETPSNYSDSIAFACGQVIVMVTSQVPLAMDLLLAEFHQACIFTVPKYLVNSESHLSKEAYLKTLGYREEDGNIETIDQYLGRVESYMKLYGALVQTEIAGVQNRHGLDKGWAWLARFLNTLPANIYTAVALVAFLNMAGFALFQKYRTQFRKILNLISNNFVAALERRGDPKLVPVICKIRTYIDTNQFSQEPETRQMKIDLVSKAFGEPDNDSSHHQNSYYY